MNSLPLMCSTAALCVLLVLSGSCGSHPDESPRDAGPLADAPAEDPPDLGFDSSPDAPDSGVEITENLCAQMCEATLQIACPDQPKMTTCVTGCLGMADICTSDGKAYYECIVRNGPASLECVQGFIALRTGYCVEENSNLADCLSR
jgi:hypothetical protein